MRSPRLRLSLLNWPTCRPGVGGGGRGGGGGLPGHHYAHMQADISHTGRHWSCRQALVMQADLQVNGWVNGWMGIHNEARRKA